MIICGVDEAGRGPVLGPLIIASYSINKNDYHIIQNIVKRDSKKYSSRQRERIFKTLININSSNILVTIVHPRIIDEWIKHLGGLNNLEAYFMSKMIKTLHPNVVYIDSCDNNPKTFLRRLIKFNIPVNINIIIETSADIKYSIVAAASIIAKVVRDNYINILSRLYGPIGSGYPSDSQTRKFLKDWITKDKNPPPIVRKSWKTIRLLF